MPIDPCQGVIAAIRTARGERIAREFIDLETPRFEPQSAVYPDPYALKREPRGLRRGDPPGDPAAEESAARRPDRADGGPAPRARSEIPIDPVRLLADGLALGPRRLCATAHRVRTSTRSSRRSRRSASMAKTLIFLLGELPYLTGLYERGRRELTPDDNLSVDGVKEMVLAARDRLKETLPKVAARVTPHLLSVYFRYVRNLAPDGPSPDARPVYAGRRRPADGRRRLRPGDRGDGPRVPVCRGGRRLRGHADRDGDRPGRGPRLGPGADGQPAAGAVAGVAELRAAAEAAGAGQAELEAAVEPLRDVLLAPRGRQDRELPPARPRPGPRDPRRRPRPLGEVHVERDGRPRHPRDPAELAHAATST